jgi:hypothetical protein
MSASTKKTRYEKAAALLNRLKHPPVPDILIFFSDVVKPWMYGVGCWEAVHRAGGRCARPHLQEGSGVGHGQPPHLLGEGDLASQLT